MPSQEDISFSFLDILFPFFIPLKGLMWIGGKVEEVAEREMTDESKIHEELLELQMRFELDEITEEEYEKREAKLMDKLEEIRKYKEEEGRGGDGGKDWTSTRERAL